MKFCVFKTEERIDKYLTKILNSSRKKIKNLFNDGRVKVNNRKSIQKSYIIKNKDLIEINFNKEDTVENFNYSNLGIKIIFENDYLVGIYKPPFFHSAKLIKNPISVESYLKSINLNYILLNRLDYETEGILLAAKNKNFFLKFKDLEKNKKIKKKYIGVLEGKLKNKTEITNQIVMDKRKKVKVIDKIDFNFFTRIYPVALYEKFTIADILIYKGARHQIRAHSSFIGHPLFYDSLYNSKFKEKKSNFFLFCYEVYCKELQFKINIKEKLKNSLKEYLKNNI